MEEKNKDNSLSSAEIILSIAVIVLMIIFAYQTVVINTLPNKDDIEKLTIERDRLKNENELLEKSQKDYDELEKKNELLKLEYKIAKNMNVKYKSYTEQCVPMFKILLSLSQCIECYYVTRDIIRMEDVFSAMLKNANELLNVELNK